jgi:MFS family permease
MMSAEQVQEKPGFRRYAVIWFGQLVSLLGSGLTSFALAVWVFQETGSAIPFAITAIIIWAPEILLSPFAGVLADRWNRKTLILVSDLGAAVFTAIAAALILGGELEVWHVYLLAGGQAIFNTFQGPAFSASVTMMVQPKDFERATSLRQTSSALDNLLTPVLAGILFVSIGLPGIILIDIITFLFATLTVIVTPIPQPKPKSVPDSSDADSDDGFSGSILKQAAYGFRYFARKPGFLALLLFFAFINFAASMATVVITPLVLSFADAARVGLVQSAAGVGMLAGSVVMGIWGGGKRAMPVIYTSILLMGVGLTIVGLRPNALLVAFGLSFALFFNPFANTSAIALLQRKTEPEKQGRVFATVNVAVTAAMPLGYLMAGIVSESVLEPAMAGNTVLARLFGPIIGIGPGRGYALFFIAAGALLILATLAACAAPRLRKLEDEVPDLVLQAPTASAES